MKWNIIRTKQYSNRSVVEVPLSVQIKGRVEFIFLVNV